MSGATYYTGNRDAHHDAGKGRIWLNPLHLAPRYDIRIVAFAAFGVHAIADSAPMINVGELAMSISRPSHHE